MILAAALCAALAVQGHASEKHPLAGMYVRSRKYVLRRAPRKEEELEGDVYYRQRERETRADWALFDHETERWTARGNVRVTWRLQGGDVVEARGHEARYDERSQRGTLAPKDPDAGLAFERVSSTGTDRGRSRSMAWDGSKGEMRLDGDVLFWGPEGRSWSESLLYQHEDRTMTLTGRRPVLERIGTDWNGAIQADTIVARRREGSVDADGQARGWLVFRDASRRPKR